MAYGDEQVALEKLQALSVEWVRLRSQTIREEETWRGEQRLLNGTVASLQLQVEALTHRSKAAASRRAENRQQLADLRQGQAALASELCDLDQAMQRLTKQISAFRPQLPPRLSDALELPFRSLGDPQVPLAERTQYIVSILTRCLQFDRKVTYAEEKITVPGGEVRLLQVLYWGLSHAYALDATNHRAYFGQPGDGAWNWTALTAGADAVEQLIAVRKERADPTFVMVPARPLRAE